MSQFIRREQACKGNPAGSGLSVPPADLVARFPALWEYLWVDRWEDGKKRETSSITIFWGDGRLKGCLNDKANARVLFVAGETLTALLEALEAALASDQAEWRPSLPGKGKRPS